MTQTTEQERATFEAKFKVPPGVTWEFGMYFVEYAQQGSYQVERFLGKWDGWQAARRAPAVPVPQGLYSACMDLIGAVHCVLHYPNSGAQRDAMRRYAGNLSAALAAAPQPPDVEQCQSCRTGSPYACTCTFKTERNSDPSCFKAAPVELPEPVYTMRVRGRMHDYTPALSAFDLADGEHKLYTEQQVRQLLAARLKPLTDEQWTKIWADWFDSAQDAEDLIRSIEKAHGITQENQG